MWSGHSCPLPLTLNRVERTSGLARPFLLTEQQRQGMPHSFRVLCGKVGSQDSQVKTTAQVARLRPDSRVHVNSQGCPVQARLGGAFSRQAHKWPSKHRLRRPFRERHPLFLRNSLDFTPAINDKQYIAHPPKCPPPTLTRFFPIFSP
jgi:hypothetical protein